MNSNVLPLVEEVLRASDAHHPADTVLREKLKARRGVSRSDATQVSQMLFRLFRWQGWLDAAQSLEARAAQAQDLEKRFSSKPESFSDEEFLARAVPGWIQKEMLVSAAWARALQQPPKLWLRARRGQGRELARRLDDCHILGQGSLGDVLRYCGRQDLFRTEAFHNGDFELQDVSSQAVGFLCDPRPGQTWWDACAGEGGKMLHLAELMENKGLIWASDRAQWRLQKLKRRAARAKVFNYRTALWNGAGQLPTKTLFDGVLVDAPCSGVGTWQRNPHARWTTTAQDVSELSALQTDILCHAAAAVKAGGKLVYAVCTLTRSETLGVVEAFEKQFPRFERQTLEDPLKPASPRLPQLYLWPQELGGNGMFVASWIRK